MKLSDTTYKPALRNMKLNEAIMQRSMLRMATGKRINSAADDPSGMAMSSKFKAMIRGLYESEQNIQFAISLLQVKEGALGEVHSMLQRMNELAVAAANGSYTDEDRAKMDLEFQQLSQGIRSVYDATEFNRRKLFEGNNTYKSPREVLSNKDKTNISEESGTQRISISDEILKKLNTELISAGLNTIDFSSLSERPYSSFKVGTTSEDYLYIQTGANEAQGFLLSNDPGSKSSEKGMDIKTVESAGKAITSTQNSINSISNQRASIGSEQKRLERLLEAIQNYRDNLEEAESRISDADMAKEMMEYTKAQVKQKAIMFVLSHAKLNMKDVLVLLN